MKSQTQLKGVHFDTHFNIKNTKVIMSETGFIIHIFKFLMEREEKELVKFENLLTTLDISNEGHNKQSF